MGAFHVFQIVQMIRNRATYHICFYESFWEQNKHLNLTTHYEPKHEDLQ